VRTSKRRSKVKDRSQLGVEKACKKKGGIMAVKGGAKSNTLRKYDGRSVWD